MTRLLSVSIYCPKKKNKKKMLHCLWICANISCFFFSPFFCISSSQEKKKELKRLKHEWSSLLCSFTEWEVGA